MNAQVIRCYLNSDLRSGHDGLAKVAQKDKIQVGQLLVGQYVVFINSKKNKVKIYAANQIVAYLRSPSGQINMNTIRDIPKVFLGRGITYDDMLKPILEKELMKRSRTIVNPPQKRVLNSGAQK